MNPLFHTEFSISDSLKNVRKSVLIYETIIVPLRRIKNILLDYQDSMVAKIIEELLSKQTAIQKYKNKNKVIKDIKKWQARNKLDKNILEECMAKQYLKMICSCIYKKVDETNDEKKEVAYKSFWMIAQYLEERGVTGIIYPCTRTNKINGKNLVLFNKYDAEPIESSIRAFDY